MKKYLFISIFSLTVGLIKSQTTNTSTGDYDVTCTRTWQECKLCGQKKTFVYRVKNYTGDEEKTVEYCVNWTLIALTNRLYIEFELGRGLTMIYPELTETVYMASEKCANSINKKHSFLTKKEDFIEHVTKDFYEGCKNNPEIKLK